MQQNKDSGTADEPTLRDAEVLRQRLCAYDPIFEKVSLEFLQSALRIIDRNRQLFERLSKY